MVLAYEVYVDSDDPQPMAWAFVPNALYVLTDRRLAPLDFALIWCDSCRAFAAGESFDSVEEIELQIAKLQRGELSEFFDFIHGVQNDVGRAENVAKDIATLQRKLHWRRLRRSPPKCLECGSTEIRSISESDPSTLFEPISNRPFKVSCVFANTNIDFRLSAYTSEGDLLGEISRDAPGDDDVFLNDASRFEVIAQRLRDIGVELPRRW